MRKTKLKAPDPGVASKGIAETGQWLADPPELERASDLLRLVGNATCLKLIYLLEREPELRVAELADRLGVSLSGISQHLAKLRLHGLVAFRREAQSLRYRLTDHPFHEKLRALVFEPSGRVGS